MIFAYWAITLFSKNGPYRLFWNANIMLACTDFGQATIIGRTLPTSDQHFSHFYFALSLSNLHFSLAPQERKLARSVDGPIFLPDFDRSRFYLYSYVCLPPCFVLYLYIMSAWHVGVHQLAIPSGTANGKEQSQTNI